MYSKEIKEQEAAEKLLCRIKTTMNAESD